MSIAEVSVISKEMEKLFIRRTEKHRAFVRNNLMKMCGYQGLTQNILKHRGQQHDLSKYEEPEKQAYIWITWKYYCQSKQIEFDYPAHIKKQVLSGWQHHIQHNLHHPEAHTNPNKMELLDIVEMVCDWTAISQELNINNNSSKPWAMENIDKKWAFLPEKKQLIFDVIDTLDQRNLSI